MSQPKILRGNLKGDLLKGRKVIATGAGRGVGLHAR